MYLYLLYFHQDYLKKWTSSSYSSYSPGAIQTILQFVLQCKIASAILPPKQQRRPLPSLLYLSFLGPTTFLRTYCRYGLQVLPIPADPPPPVTCLQSGFAYNAKTLFLVTWLCCGNNSGGSLICVRILTHQCTAFVVVHCSISAQLLLLFSLLRKFEKKYVLRICMNQQTKN